MSSKKSKPEKEQPEQEHVIRSGGVVTESPVVHPDPLKEKEKEEKQPHVRTGRFRPRWTMIAFMVLVLVFSAVLKTCFDAGEFKLLAQRGVHDCERLDGPPGLEDMAVYRNRWLIASSLYREDMHSFSSETRMTGNLFVSDLNVELTPATFHPDMPAATMRGFDPKLANFSPHGMAIDDASDLLMAISHAPHGDCIEVFQLSEENPGGQASLVLTHVRTLRHPKLHVINDLDFRADPRSPAWAPRVVLWASLWMRHAPHTLMGQIEIYTQRPWGGLLRCSVELHDPEGGVQCDQVVDKQMMPNGVALVGEHKDELILAKSSTTKDVAVYTVGLDNELTLMQELYVNSMCDNVGVERNVRGELTGSLLLGCHPKGISFLVHSKDPFDSSAPSQVLRLSKNTADGVSYVWEEIFLSPGNLLSGDLSASSIGVSHAASDMLLIGAVFQPGLLKCPLPH